MSWELTSTGQQRFARPATVTSTQSALEVLLRNLRNQKDEVQLTRCFIELSNADPGIGRGLAEVLLEAATDDPTVGTRAATLLQALPAEASWSGEERMEGDVRRVRLRRTAVRGRLDWLVEASHHDAHASPGFLLGIEVKIDAPVRNPLDSYYRELERRGAEHWGLLLLGRHRPPASDLLSPGAFDHWLGVVLWHDVIRGLHRIRPNDDAMASAWPSFLSVLSADDDLGALPIVSLDLVGDDRKNKLLALARMARTTVEDAACAELAARPLGRRARSDLAVVVHSRVAGSPDAVALRCYIGVVDDDPAIEFELRARDGCAELTARVWPTQFRIARRKTHSDQQAAAERLTGLEPPFHRHDESYTRQRVVGIADGDLRDAITTAIVADVTNIISTGAVDHNV